MNFKLKFIKPAESICDKPDYILEENVTTFTYNPNHNLSIANQRDKLPVRSIRDHILFSLDTHQTVVLIGETGCGKSTQVPQYLLEAGWGKKGMIAVTQPRRVAAVTLATRVAEERGVPLGDEVGYSVRFDDCTADNTAIKFMTEGILLREMLASPLLSQYSVVIVDEAHERNMLTDMLLGLLKKILKKRKTLHLVISSATVDAEFLKDYFNDTNKKGDAATILSVSGRAYSVDVHYLKEPVPDYITATVDTVLKIHKTEAPGDILCFLTGMEEVVRAKNLLAEHCHTKEFENLMVLPMYGSLPNADQLKVFFSAPHGKRKVILATNIAETSVTIPGIVYVIDCGYMKLKVFNPTAHIDSLIVVPISKANGIQRAGRAGRIQPGKVYRLFTEEAWMNLHDNIAPEMQRSDLSSTVLQLKALGVDNVLRFDYPSPPPSKNLVSALELLYALGALKDDGELTENIGYKMAEMSIEPMMAKVLLQSGEMGCSDEILSIISMLQVQNVFIRPTSGQSAIKARIARREFEVEEGDLITLLNVFSAFIDNGRTKEFCNKYYLNYKNLKRANEIKTQLKKFLSNKFNLEIVSCGRNIEALRRCLTWGLFPNAAYLHYSGCYKTIRGEEELHIHPNSCLYTTAQPDWVLFCELLHTSKAYMTEITVIDKSWLIEIAPHYYQETSDLVFRNS